MTRKALRKRLRTQAKQASRPVTRFHPPAPWVTVGAFVASAALTTAPPASGSVPNAESQRSVLASGRRPPLVRLVSALPEFAPAGLQDGVSQDPPARRYDISAGPLGEMLRQFESLSGVTVSLTLESIGTVQSPGVRGILSVEQALRALLMGTGVTFRFTSSSAVILDLQGRTETVEVTGQAPAAIVSSPKYSAPLRETPQTIEVIPREVIEEQGVTTLSEALRNVPGISLQAGEGGGASNTAGDMFNLRGFNAANSLFVDGVRDDGLISRDVFNMEQVEVFMGPTGSDIGRGTAAGYVNMTTKAPRLSSGAAALFSYGSADHMRLTVDLERELPFGPAGSWWSRSAVRLNGLWQQGGVAGRDEVDEERRAIAPSLAIGLGTPTRLTLAAQIMRQDNLPDYGIPGAAWEEPLTPTTVLAPAPVAQSNFFGSIGYDYDTASQDSYTARIEHDVNSSLTLRNQTRYNRAHREAVITTIQNVAAYDATTNLVTLARQGNDRENTIVSNQTYAVARFSTRGLSHAVSLGVEYNFEEQTAPGLTGLGTRAPANIFNPNPHDPVLGYAPTRSGALTEGRTHTVAASVFDTVNLDANWQVNGGIRVERYTTGFQAVATTGAVTTDLEASDVVVSGKAGLLYRITDAGNVYFSYGTSVTPPGTANFTLSAQPNNQNNPSVDPQYSTNYEVGSKWDFGSGRLSLNTAIFRTENRNVIFTVDATTIPPIYNQDDSQRVRGATIGTIGRITDRLEVLASFAYLDSSLETQNDTNRGNQLTLTPKYSTSIWTTYRLPRGLNIGGGFRATDKVYVNAANTIHSPGYCLFDALVEKAINRNLTLRLNLYNMTDAVYIRNVNNNGGRYNPGYPRAVLLTSGVTF